MRAVDMAPPALPALSPPMKTRRLQMPCPARKAVCSRVHYAPRLRTAQSIDRGIPFAVDDSTRLCTSVTPGCEKAPWDFFQGAFLLRGVANQKRSEEHTSELQSQSNLVCRLLLEKKNLCRTPLC